MSIASRDISYSTNGQEFAGRLYHDPDATEPAAGVAIAHTIRGRSAFEEAKARQIAERGYAGLALDVYGRQHIGSEEENTRAQMTALLADRTALHERMLAGLAAFAAQPEVDPDRLGVIGYCFGGLCGLDLARIDAPIRCAISVHGLFTPLPQTDCRRSSVAVLALHGWDDPLAQPQTATALAQELTDLGCDWQIHAYGHTMHAFSNPAANDHTRGTVYSPRVDRRSQQAITQFLAEQLGQEQRRTK